MIPRPPARVFHALASGVLALLLAVDHAGASFDRPKTADPSRAPLSSLTYDERGNRTSQEITVAGDCTQVSAYTWDHQNRLTGVTTPDGAQHHYTYDYRTRRNLKLI